MKSKYKSVAAIVMLLVWAFVVVCSDDILAYADVDFGEFEQFSSSIFDSHDFLSESSTDFVLQDSHSIRNRVKNANYFSRARILHSVLARENVHLKLIQSKRHIFPLELDEFLNEKIIMEYIHRQDGDK